MKIAGLTYLDGRKQLYLKPDTALLVNKKPFFLPHFSDKITAHAAVVVKISKMGRCINSKFASRYYSELAPAVNFMALDNDLNDVDKVTKAVAFDNSMAVGEFVEVDALATQSDHFVWLLNDQPLAVDGLIEDLNNAVAQVSNYITLRMGDMVAVDLKMKEPILLKREDVIQAQLDDQLTLFCRVK